MTDQRASEKRPSGVAARWRSKRLIAVLVAALAVAIWQFGPIGTEPASAAAKPSAPTITSIVGGAGSIEIEWTAPAQAGKTAIEAYRLSWRVDSKGKRDWQGAKLSADARSHEIDGLKPNKSYVVRVRAVNANGGGKWATSQPVEVRAQRKPLNAIVSASCGEGSHLMGLTFRIPLAPIGEITHYQYRYKRHHDRNAAWTSGEISAERAALDPEILTTPGAMIVFYGLDTSVAYRFLVRAVDAAGKGPWSDAAYNWVIKEGDCDFS